MAYLDFDLHQERDFDAMENIFKSRMRLKKLSQLSYELKTLENSLGIETYNSFEAPRIAKMYQLLETKVLEVAEEIKHNS